MVFLSIFLYTLQYPDIPYVEGWAPDFQNHNKAQTIEIMVNKTLVSSVVSRLQAGAGAEQTEAMPLGVSSMVLYTGHRESMMGNYP